MKHLTIALLAACFLYCAQQVGRSIDYDAKADAGLDGGADAQVCEIHCPPSCETCCRSCVEIETYAGNYDENGALRFEIPNFNPDFPPVVQLWWKDGVDKWHLNSIFRLDENGSTDEMAWVPERAWRRWVIRIVRPDRQGGDV